jgi:hypothetical protein
MVKQGMHNNDHQDSDVSRGHRNHRKRTPITTGSYKTPERYRKQIRAYQDTAQQAQDAKNIWYHDTHHPPEKIDRRGRSDSNASSDTRGY